jgi:hypothetical protein
VSSGSYGRAFPLAQLIVVELFGHIMADQCSSVCILDEVGKADRADFGGVWLTGVLLDMFRNLQRAVAWALQRSGCVRDDGMGACGRRVDRAVIFLLPLCVGGKL